MAEDYSTVAGYLNAKLDEQVRETEEFLGGGNVKDFNEYQKLCGVIQGLGRAKRILADLANRMKEEEDE